VASPFITDLDKVLAFIPANQWGRYDRRFKIGGVKITIDGSPQGRTAFFTTPTSPAGRGARRTGGGNPPSPRTSSTGR
jgi:predicted amidohydrolase YtcJ